MTLTPRDLLNDGKVHVLDGAMGTMLYAKGFFLNVCYDELSVKQPKLVQEVHEAYVRAGAEILETNTFGANPVKLRTYGLADDTEHINRTAAELARKASAGRASVVGAIGPLGVRLEPFGALSREDRPDDDRGRRPHALRHGAGDLRPAARRVGRRRDRRELLGRAGRRARGGREAGQGHRSTHLRRAQRGPAQRRGRPQDLSRV